MLSAISCVAVLVQVDLERLIRLEASRSCFHQCSTKEEELKLLLLLDVGANKLLLLIFNYYFHPDVLLLLLDGLFYNL